MEVTTGLKVNFDGENGNFAVIKAESDGDRSSPQFCTNPVLEPDTRILLFVHWMPSSISSCWEVLGRPSP